MCEVCAVFGLGRHWTDAEGLADPTLPAPDIARYRVERRHRIRLFNSLVAGTGVVLSDWDGESFWLERRDGCGERVADMGRVWEVAERLAARPIDPLADDFASSRS